MEVGKSYECPLVVISSSPRTTRAGKPYLVMELYDGVESITCNYWDWSGEVLPKKNTVYTFKVDCTEYLNKKQLTCKHVKANAEEMLEDFMPQSDYDIAECYKNFYALIAGIKDDFYRECGLKIAEDAKHYWLHTPSAVTVHHNYMGGNLVHCLHVGQYAKAIADQIPNAWSDLALIGGLLHDVGKLFTYDLEGLTIDYTEDGTLLEHVFMGAEFVGNMAEEFIKDEFDELKLQLLRHIILSHHQKLEYGSPVTPRCLEAWIVSHADAIDAQYECIREASKKVSNERFTERIWNLNNAKHFTIQATNALKNKGHIVGIYDYLNPTA